MVTHDRVGRGTPVHSDTPAGLDQPPGILPGGHVQSPDCWCGPYHEHVCMVCSGRGCPACHDGWVEGYNPDSVNLTVHNEAEEA